MFSKLKSLSMRSVPQEENVSMKLEGEGSVNISTLCVIVKLNGKNGKGSKSLKLKKAFRIRSMLSIFMKYLLLINLFILMGCQSARIHYNTPTYSITTPEKGVTNCYLKNNIYPWYSSKKEADLVIKGEKENEFPKKLLTSVINENELIETYLFKYKIVEIIKGKTKEKTLTFISAIHWDKRIKQKRIWPYPDNLTFYLDSNDYQIVNVEK